MKKININPEKCAACHLCEMACSFKHYRKFSSDLSNVRIKTLEDKADSKPLNCFQCEQRYCINACHFGALHIDNKTGAVLVDQGKCKKCKACIKACVYNGVRMIELGDNQIISICDLCSGDPECVKVCMQKSLTYI